MAHDLGPAGGQPDLTTRTPDPATGTTGTTVVARDLVWRAGLVLDAVVLCGLGVPAWLAGIAAAAAVVAVAERVARHRRRGLLDGLIAAIVGPLVALMALGFVLDVVPGGVTRVSWSVGAGVLALTALAVCATRPLPPPIWAGSPRLPRATVAWSVLAGLIAVAAFAVSIRSARQVEDFGVALSVRTSGGVTRAVVTSGTDAGPFVLRIETGDASTGSTGSTGSTVLVPALRVRAGETVSVPLLVRDGTRSVISLSNPSQDQPVRSVVLDRRRP